MKEKTKEKLSRSERVKTGFATALVYLIMFASLLVLRGAIVSILWNYVMPVIFNLPKIGVGQAILLTLLVSFAAADFSTTKD